MKRAGRITGILLLAGMMTLSVLVGYRGDLLAADADFPEGDTQGTITIHKFDADSFENLKTPTGTEADASQLPADAKALAGVEFTLERLDDKDGKPVSVNTKVDTSFTAQTGKTDQTGSLSFGNLDKGYYLVTETVPETYGVQKDKFVVMLPMKTYGADGSASWNYDVHVYPKNTVTSGEITKERSSSHAVVGVGSEIQWKIRYTLGKNMAQDTEQGRVYATDFYLYDQMDSRLDYRTDSVKFQLLDEADKELADVTLEKGVDYQESYDAASHQVRWDFTDEAVKKLVDGGVATVQAVAVTTVNESAIGTIEVMWNNAGIEFTNAEGDPYHQEVFPEDDDKNNEDVPKVYLGSIHIDKYQEGNEAVKVKDVCFKIAQSEEDAKKEQYLQRDGKDYEVITDENGVAEFTALKAGTYYLVETKAASGYEGLKEPVKVEIGDEEASAVVKVSIPNPLLKKGASSDGGTLSKLPSAIQKTVKTGDVARIGLLIAVLLAAAIVIIVLIYRRKKQNQKD